MSTGFVRDSSSQYPWILKGPDEDLNYAIAWADPKDNWLGAATITKSDWFVVPMADVPSLQKHGEAVNGGNTPIVWLSGGVVGAKYLVTSQIETSDGRIGQRTFEVRVVKR